MLSCGGMEDGNKEGKLMVSPYVLTYIHLHLLIKRIADDALICVETRRVAMICAAAAPVLFDDSKQCVVKTANLLLLLDPWSLQSDHNTAIHSAQVQISCVVCLFCFSSCRI
ncbi:hypothetical protein ATANTOWER_008951 [Ataeniobius toweri]|uniref:Uncharacterized protein n=1 Tax=Ataeniobius toweri TaxID=208326 RepID=A0ABU7A2F0_9TELE|nr:hypothetical protein [Ataeniobius toweri]